MVIIYKNIIFIRYIEIIKLHFNYNIKRLLYK